MVMYIQKCGYEMLSTCTVKNYVQSETLWQPAQCYVFSVYKHHWKCLLLSVTFTENISERHCTASFHSVEYRLLAMRCLEMYVIILYRIEGDFHCQYNQSWATSYGY